MPITCSNFVPEMVSWQCYWPLPRNGGGKHSKKRGRNFGNPAEFGKGQT